MQKSKRYVVQQVPELREGVNLLISEESPIQQLVAEELRFGGEAIWIDAGNEASTYDLAEHGTEDLLNRVKVARAFTPFQHHTAVHEVQEFVDDETELLVLSNVDALYLDGQLNREEAEELFAETLEKVVEAAEKENLKVLMTSASDELEFKLRVVADNVVESEKTVEGRKFRSGEFETKAYREAGAVQTCLNFWEDEVIDDGENERHLQEPSRQPR